MARHLCVEGCHNWHYRVKERRFCQWCGLRQIKFGDWINVFPISDELREYIAKLAFEKWEAAGKPINKDLFFWLEAEKEVMYNGGIRTEVV
jgi:hypothetical protein